MHGPLCIKCADSHIGDSHIGPLYAQLQIWAHCMARCSETPFCMAHASVAQREPRLSQTAFTKNMYAYGALTGSSFSRDPAMHDMHVCYTTSALDCPCCELLPSILDRPLLRKQSSRPWDQFRNAPSFRGAPSCDNKAARPWDQQRMSLLPEAPILATIEAADAGTNPEMLRRGGGARGCEDARTYT
jgi:hypothetical protein